MKLTKNDIKKIIEKHSIMKYPNVIGYSNTLQYKIRKGVVLPIPSIRIYVTRKLPESMLKKDEIIPKELDGIPTDIVEIGKLKKLQGYRERYRPAPCGVSTSRLDENAAGTIGWWVIDEDGNPYLISNNHVWAKENNAAQGDPIVQPGVLDGGTEDDVIAELYDFIAIDFAGNPNHVDVALATPVDMSKLYTSIMELGGVTGKRDPVINEIVCKVGRSTGKTCGEVIDDSATVNVDYASGTALFEDVFLVQSSEKIVENGDSGSPVLSENGEFLGLLFAGNDEGTLFVACKQSYIEAELQSKLGKKIWILVANSYPPFQKEKVIITQEVYPPSFVLYGLTIQFMTILMFMTTALNVITMSYRELR